MNYDPIFSRAQILRHYVYKHFPTIKCINQRPAGVRLYMAHKDAIHSDYKLYFDPVTANWVLEDNHPNSRFKLISAESTPEDILKQVKLRMLIEGKTL